MKNTSMKLVAFVLALFLISHYGGVEARVATQAFEPCKTDADCVGKCALCAGTLAPNCTCLLKAICICTPNTLVDTLVSHSRSLEKDRL
ncbi:hypothetical protein LINGRAHAP2_LOCUS12646 [Linum grandiflorum]